MGKAFLVLLILSFNFNFYTIFSFLIVLGIYNFNFYSIFRESIFNKNIQFLETYECRFDTFNNKIFTYNLQFFNIRVSYIVFDLEISVLFYFFYLLITFNFS